MCGSTEPYWAPVVGMSSSLAFRSLLIDRPEVSLTLCFESLGDCMVAIDKELLDKY